MSKNRVQDLPPSMHPKAVGPRIVAARKALDLKQSEMADSLGVDRAAWSKYERGVRALPDHIAFRAAERYGLTMDFFFRGRLDAIQEPLRGEIFRRMNAVNATS